MRYELRCYFYERKNFDGVWLREPGDYCLCCSDDLNEVIADFNKFVNYYSDKVILQIVEYPDAEYSDDCYSCGYYYKNFIGKAECENELMCYF